MFKYYVKNSSNEIERDLDKQNRNLDLKSVLKNFTFYEFTLKECNLPSAEELLENVKKVADTVKLQSWKMKNKSLDNYKGFSLTYNPEFHDQKESIYHQTYGSNFITQNFSRKNEPNLIFEKKNTYYDTYGFRHIPPVVEKYLGNFINKFSMPLLRSRVSYFNQTSFFNIEKHFHKDEYPYNLVRVNIPLQTRKEHVLSIKGEDEHGNKLTILNKHLEIGKMYIWNTRIPHAIHLLTHIPDPFERIHLVLGFSPWYHYNKNDDSFTKSPLWGLNLDTIVNNKLFLK